jgi:hypothetical protein
LRVEGEAALVRNCIGAKPLHRGTRPFHILSATSSRIRLAPRGTPNMS